jgi:photosystem II protein
MTVQIQFLEGISETTLPYINVTKSKNRQTATATFIFIQPSIFEVLNYQKNTIRGMYLLWEKKKTTSTDIEITFRNGEPFMITTVFLFINAKEWFNFLSFMRHYSKERGLSFILKNKSFEE